MLLSQEPIPFVSTNRLFVYTCVFSCVRALVRACVCVSVCERLCTYPKHMLDFVGKVSYVPPPSTTSFPHLEPPLSLPKYHFSSDTIHT